MEHFQDCGPAGNWESTLFLPVDQFKTAGYAAMLVGQQVPYRRRIQISDSDHRQFQLLRQRHKAIAQSGFTIPETLALLRAANWESPIGHGADASKER